MKKIILIFISSIFTHLLFSSPKMIGIHDGKNNINIEISETLVTMKDYKEYVIDNNLKSIKDFEDKKLRERDIYGEIKFQDEWPLWNITWRESAEYCNWLSQKNGYRPCYKFEKSSKNPKYGEVIIDKSANGYRMPYIRELLILSGIKDGLSKEKFEKENLCNLEEDINKMIPSTVYRGRKNEYGIYDLLGNLEQYCNDYFNEEFDYFDFSLSFYGPDSYTPDPDQVYYKEPLTAVRCYFGGFWAGNYERIMKRVIFDVNEISDGFVGIRLVRNIEK